MKNIILFSLFLFVRNANSQTYFNLVPDFGGDWGAGIIYNVLPLQNEIKIIGLLHDSIVPGLEGGDWPILGTISYEGEYKTTKYLIDSLYTNGFRYQTFPIIFVNDSICLMYARRSVGEEYVKSILMLMNINSGHIIKSKIIEDKDMNLEPFLPRTFAWSKQGNVYLINSIEEHQEQSQVLTVLDDNWNIITQRRIDPPGSSYFANYFNIDDDGNGEIVGVNFGEDTPVWWESQLYFQILDSAGISQYLTFAESNVNHSIILADAYPILKSNAGDWLIASQEVIETHDCQGCSVYIPYVVCLSSDFSTLKWERRIYDGDENSSIPYQVVSSITEVSDGFIFVSRRNGIIGPETCALLGKVSLNGDSLWTRKYIPSGWTEDQALWFNLKDIKTTPRGDIVVGGYGRDRFNEITVPWIMHLDKDGCLESGCLSTSVSPEGDQLPLGLQVHPNPARDQVYIHIKAEKMTSPPYNLEIFASDGRSVHSATIDFADTYYMLDVRSWADGIYIVHVSDQEQRAVSRQLIVVH